MRQKFYKLILMAAICSSCSPTGKLSNKTFVSVDALRQNSLEFINDSICIYKQQFLCEVETPFDEMTIICHYSTERNKLIIRNLTNDSDSIATKCFEIPETKLLNCFLVDDTINAESYTYLGGKVALSMYDMYGYFNNISVDTLHIQRKRIKYEKMNECFPYVMYVNTVFLEK